MQALPLVLYTQCTLQRNKETRDLVFVHRTQTLVLHPLEASIPVLRENVRLRLDGWHKTTRARIPLLPPLLPEVMTVLAYHRDLAMVRTGRDRMADLGRLLIIELHLSLHLLSLHLNRSLRPSPNRHPFSHPLNLRSQFLHPFS